MYDSRTVYDSSTVYDSRTVYDSHTVYNSNTVYDSRTVYNSNTVYNSRALILTLCMIFALCIYNCHTVQAKLRSTQARNQFEACLAMLNQDGQLPPLAEGETDAAFAAAHLASERLKKFIEFQTAIHHNAQLGDKRRKGAMGSHNASVLEEAQWPLEFSARAHEQACAVILLLTLATDCHFLRSA